MAKKNKIVLMAIIIVLAVVILTLATYSNLARHRSVVVINGQRITVELANTPEMQTRGLSGRWFLGKNRGMLFVFNDYSRRSFWMKDMNFPLDIIWIRNGIIIDLSKNLPPEGEKPAKIYQPIDPVNDVLEVQAGFADQNGLKIGDKVEIEAKK
jgi:uncharacterized membrane protein (UPF0127 family)